MPSLAGKGATVHMGMTQMFSWMTGNPPRMPSK